MKKKIGVIVPKVKVFPTAMGYLCKHIYITPKLSVSIGRQNDAWHVHLYLEGGQDAQLYTFDGPFYAEKNEEAVMEQAFGIFFRDMELAHKALSKLKRFQNERRRNKRGTK